MTKAGVTTAVVVRTVDKVWCKSSIPVMSHKGICEKIRHSHRHSSANTRVTTASCWSTLNEKLKIR